MSAEHVRKLCEEATKGEARDAYESGMRRMAINVLEAFDYGTQPSYPKHLPPRDCLVLVDHGGARPLWLHARYWRPDDAPEWIHAYDGNTIDPSRVITWRELPEVE